MPTMTSWPGTRQEQLAVLRAVTRNCTCEFGPLYKRISVCSAHRMLAEDQRAVSGLVFGRRMAERLQCEEGLRCARVPTVWKRTHRAEPECPGPSRGASCPQLIVLRPV